MVRRGSISRGIMVVLVMVVIIVRGCIVRVPRVVVVVVAQGASGLHQTRGKPTG
jgi:hypothetical protein